MTIRSRLLLLLLPPLTAFLILASFYFYFNWSREFLLGASCVTLIFVIGAVFLIADRISKPVSQLNHAALEIAAGNYETDIQVQGPKEIMELAHTLNTMSQCLVENISRLKESSLIRERMYGEYECALLLQDYMLQKVIEEFRQPQMRMRLISLALPPLQKGLLLKVDRSCAQDLIVRLIEAQEMGFPGLFQLNQWMHLPNIELKKKSYIECRFMDLYRVLRYDAHHLHPPLVWSVEAKKFIKSESKDIPLQNKDMVFLYNSCFNDYFENLFQIEEWFSKVLRHFAEDGLDSIHTMLTNELTFLAKKQQTKQNYKIISMQLHLG